MALAFRDSLMVPCDLATYGAQTFCPHHSRSAWRALAGTVTAPATPWDDVRLLLHGAGDHEAWHSAAPQVALARRVLAAPAPPQIYDGPSLKTVGQDALQALAREQGVLTDAELHELRALPKVPDKRKFFARKQEAAASALGFVAAQAPFWARARRSLIAT
jgi:hypothetical protein